MQPARMGCRCDLPPDGARLEFNASAVRLLGEWGNGTEKPAECARARLRLVAATGARHGL